MNLSSERIDKNLVNDIIDWDVVNWVKALYFWEENIDIKSKELQCLELGAGGGGLSLWLAINGNKVICSDLESPEERASQLHAKYSCEDNISYQGISATDIPFENRFDIVLFKSIVGGVSGDARDELKVKAIDEMYKCLKPGGKLLFAENLESSFIHMYFREKYKNTKRAVKWNYLNYKEVEPMFTSFEKLKFKTVGFFGTFGRTEKQRHILGKIDSLIEGFIPKSKRYIVFGIATK